MPQMRAEVKLHQERRDQKLATMKKERIAREEERQAKDNHRLNRSASQVLPPRMNCLS